jgi:hypothetical protein
MVRNKESGHIGRRITAIFQFVELLPTPIVAAAAN